MAQKVYKDVNSMLHDFAMDKIFTPENAEKAKGSLPEPEPLFQKGERVTFSDLKNRPDLAGEHEIVGFYSGGEVVDQNTADPYNKHYGVRIKNTKTGKEYPVTSNFLRRIG